MKIKEIIILGTTQTFNFQLEAPPGENLVNNSVTYSGSIIDPDGNVVVTISNVSEDVTFN